MSTVIIDKRPSYSGSKTPYSPGIVSSPGNLTPRIISTLFILALQHFFISNPEYHWDPDANKTDLDIHADWEEDDNLEKGLPAIIVQNGPVAISPVGIGTGLTTMEKRLVKRDGKIMDQPAILNSRLQATIDSNITISITGISADDVNELAFTIGIFLLTLKYDIASILQLQQLGNVQISQAQAMSKTGWTNRYISQIVVPYSFVITRTWEPVDAGVLIKDLKVSLDTKKHTKTNGRNYTHSTIKQIGD